MTEERECKRPGVPPLFLAFLLFSAFFIGTPLAAAQDYKMTCPNEHKSMRLSVSGNYHAILFPRWKKLPCRALPALMTRPHARRCANLPHKIWRSRLPSSAMAARRFVALSL